MPPRDMPHGADTLTTACYLAKGPDDPGFQDWARNHSDWIVAGTWTAAEPGAGGDGLAQSGPAMTLDGHALSEPPSQPPDRGTQAVRPSFGIGKPPPEPLDPATISLADFRDVAATAKAGEARQGPTIESPSGAPISRSPQRRVDANRLRQTEPEAGAEAGRTVDAINDAMVAHGIDSPGQRAAFLAQMAAETRQLQESLDDAPQRSVKVLQAQFPDETTAQPGAGDPIAPADRIHAGNGHDGDEASGKEE